MKYNDTDILTTLKKDIEAGGNMLFQRYYKPLVLFGDSFIEESDSSEDIVQDVFYRFIKNKAYMHVAADALATYLFRCVKNQCLNEIRKHQKLSYANTLYYQTLEEEVLSISPEIISNIREAISQLPEKTRQVINSVIIQGKKYRETAEEMNISVNTVKSTLSSGLKKLRNQFSDELLLLYILHTIPDQYAEC